MTIDHRAEALRLLDVARTIPSKHNDTNPAAALLLTEAQVHATLATIQPHDEVDLDSAVLALIAEIASRLTDATDGGEYQAVGLIYDLANGDTTVADARADLAAITFRHV